MKKTKILLLALIMLTTSVTWNVDTANAASYPLFSPETYSQTYYIGDMAYFTFEIFPEYKNESMNVSIYDEYGRCVASADNDFYNYDTFYRKYTVNWDTKGDSAGKYKVVATMKFYTYFEWHDCPTSKTINVTLKKKPKKGVSIKSAKVVQNDKIRVKWKKVKNAKKYEVKIGNKKYKTRKTTFTSKSLKTEKWYKVRVRAYVDKSYGTWCPTRLVWISSAD